MRSISHRLPVVTRREWLTFLFASATTVLAGVLVLPQAWFLTRWLGDVFPRTSGSVSWRGAVAALAAVIAARGALMAISKWGAARFAFQVKLRMRRMMLRKLIALGPAEVRRRPAGEWLAWLTDGIENMDNYLATYLPQAAASATVPFAILLFAAVEDRWTALILAITVPFMVLLLIVVGSSAQKATDRRWKTLEQLSGHFLDVVRGIWTLKVFGRSRPQVDVIERVADDYRAATMRVLTLAFLSSLVTELFSMVSIGLVAVSLGIRLLSGHMEFQTALVLLLLAPEYYQPIRTAGAQYHTARDGVAMLERYCAMMETPSPVVAPRANEQFRMRYEIGVAIEFRNVTVRYPGASVPALEDVSFRLEPHKFLAIVGASGAGKSTILAVLLGFIRPEAGEVLIDGVPLDQIDLTAWRSRLGYVAQEPVWLHASLRHNLTWGEPLSEEAVNAALYMSGLDEVVNGLPQGADTIIDGERVQLSGGEKQRLALARLVLRQPTVALLDEPTRSLDFATERVLEERLVPWLQRLTAIAVVHRLGLALVADCVLVLDGGRVVESGRPEELIRAGGAFQSMVERYRGQKVLA